MNCTVADSSGLGNPKLPTSLRTGFEAICNKLGATLVMNEAPKVPVQDGPDCLFHTLLSQIATVTKLPFPDDDNACQTYATVLRLYAAVLAIQDWGDCVTVVNAPP
jgi:hypothetical protein